MTPKALSSHWVFRRTRFPLWINERYFLWRATPAFNTWVSRWCISRRFTSIPIWPNIATPTRVSILKARPVMWQTSGPTWAPITSAGKNIENPFWIPTRSWASLLSDVQIRSVNSRIPKSARPPPDEQLSISTSGWALRIRANNLYRLRVCLWPTARPFWSPGWCIARFMSHFK